MFKLALVQMRVEGGRKEQNLRHALDLIQQAALSGARIAVLPEAASVGWTDPSSAAEAEPIPEGSWCVRLCEAAKAHHIYVCSGIVEKAAILILS
jgi:predicted amidohydrolase